MFNIPLKFVLFSPEIDVLIFIFISYFFLFKFYKILLKKRVNEISWIDLKVSVIFLALGYINYSGLEIFNISWWSYIISVQLLVEGFFVFVYWKEVKIYLKKIKEKNKKNKVETLNIMVQEMNLIKNMIEEDLEKSRVEGDKKKERILKKEIEKISEDIKKTEEKLRDLEKNKND